MKKIYLIILLFSILFCACQTQNSKTVQLIIGTYTNEDSKGIYSVDFNIQSGELLNKKLIYKIDDPTFQQFDSENNLLWSIGKNNGINYLLSFKQNNNKQFVFHDSICTNQNGICHIAYNNHLKIAVGSNYASGSITQASFSNKHNFIEVKNETHFGKSINTSRQEAPHAHSVAFNNNIAYACDLGADKIYIYNEKDNWLKVADSINTDPGTGPRHLTFSADGNTMAVLNELASSITLYKKNSNDIFTKPIASYSTLPDTVRSFSKAADIHYSPNGKFLYASNRGFNSIAVFQQEQSKLKLVEIETNGCNWIRNFAISPDGKFLIAANRYGNNLTIYKIDQTSGALQLTNNIIKINQPVCVTVIN